MSAGKWTARITPLDRSHDRAAFYSGNHHLDQYLKRQAGQDIRRRIAQVYVATDGESSKVIGFYSLSSYAVTSDTIPEAIATKLPRYDKIPCALIGRLAVDETTRGQGRGRQLLMHALSTCLELSGKIGIYAVVVDAKDDSAKAFYEKYDFIPFPSNSRKLFLPLATVRKAFGK